MTPQLTEVQAFEDLLTVDNLAALMRSTWTWDDRALRHDLADLLVDLEAAHCATAGDTLEHAECLRARALESAAEFVAAVLGPKLIADAGNPLRHDFLAPALDAARFARTASSAFDRVRQRARGYASRHAANDYPPESSWLTLVATEGSLGLGSAMRAYGYGLCASNLFGNAGLAWQTIRAVEDESDHAAQYAKAIESGSITATLAAAEQSGSWDPALVRTKAVRGQDGWQLSGLKLFVPAADGADVYFVIARSIAGPSLFAVRRGAPGLQVTPLDVIDERHPLFQVEFADTPAILISTEGGGGRLMTAVTDLATTALAGEQVGLIEKSMSLLAEANAPEPELAEVTLHHVAATSLWRHALAEEANSSADFPAAAAAAHIGCSRAAVQAATVAAKLLGPSDETDTVFKRALSANLLFGGPALSHERLLERLGV